MSSATPASITPMDPSVRGRLSLMMFLQYFVWGAWFVTLGTYLSNLRTAAGERHFTDPQIGSVYGTAAIAAMLAPFFVGMVADRFFSTQQILAVLHLVGGGLLYWASTLNEFSLFYPAILGYFLCYMPTLALTNSLSFHHMSAPDRQFPGIRVLGTIGWIVAGQVIGWMKIEATHEPMQIAAAVSALLGVYCLALPHTPPKNRGTAVTLRDVLGLDALQLMKQWPFAVFVVGSFLICIPLQFYYSWTNPFLNEIGVQNAAAKMTIGQMSEIVFMLIMPLFFVRLGVKYMLLVGMFCWAARYVLFAFGNADANMWMLYLGLFLHGICYDFFFVTGQIYVDKKASNAIRGAAQGFIAFVTLGVGGYIGNMLAGETVGKFATAANSHNWFDIWLVPAAAAGVVMVLFAILFRDKVETT